MVLPPSQRNGDNAGVNDEDKESAMEVNEGSTSMVTTTTSPLVAVRDTGSVAQEVQRPPVCWTSVEAAWTGNGIKTNRNMNTTTSSPAPAATRLTNKHLDDL